MSSYLEKIKAGTVNVQVMKYPGSDKDIEVRVLSNQDMLDAALAADSLFKKADIPVQMHNVNEYEIEKDTQRMFRACREPGTKNAIASSITEFRALMTPAERSAIIEAYNTLDADCNPSPAEMSAEDFDALVLRLKKNPESTIGSISNTASLKRLCLFLANPASNSPKDSGSTSS